MPVIRIERLPVQHLGLGILGFDHLQLVYQPDGRGPAAQEGWFVLEGLREVDGQGSWLGVEGWHGATTLGEANGGRTGEALEILIGTPAMRGSRELASGTAAADAWASFVSFATEIERQKFPYQAYALPTSPGPTLNSSSLIASLLHHAGFDVASSLPAHLRFSPGLDTLLGTSGDDGLATENGFTAVLAGAGQDVLAGSRDAGRVDKLYGGRGDDRLVWSEGFNILHGGEPHLAYAQDGRDTVDYSGVGHVTIEAAPGPREHERPDFIARSARATDHLFSIEELLWGDESDTVTLGRGVMMLHVPLTLRLEGGDDVVDASAAEMPLVVEAGAGADTVLVGRESLRVRGGPGKDHYIVAGAVADLVIEDAEPDDRLLTAGDHARPARAHLDPSGDLTITITGRERIEARVVIQSFEPGDLGLDDIRLAANDGGALVYLSPVPAPQADIPIELALASDDWQPLFGADLQTAVEAESWSTWATSITFEGFDDRS